MDVRAGRDFRKTAGQTLYLLLILIVHRASYLQHCFLCVCCPLETMLKLFFPKLPCGPSNSYFNWEILTRSFKRLRKEKNICGSGIWRGAMVFFVDKSPFDLLTSLNQVPVFERLLPDHRLNILIFTDWRKVSWATKARSLNAEGR